MEFRMSVWSSDPSVVSEIAQIEIDGVTIRQPNVIREIFNPPVDFIFTIVATMSANVAAQLIAKKIWEILKKKKEPEFKIDYQPVEINVQKIEVVIINRLKEKEKESSN
jgi:hypothetical protein